MRWREMKMKWTKKLRNTSRKPNNNAGLFSMVEATEESVTTTASTVELLFWRSRAYGTSANQN